MQVTAVRGDVIRETRENNKDDVSFYTFHSYNNRSDYIDVLTNKNQRVSIPIKTATVFFQGNWLDVTPKKSKDHT